MNDTMQDAGLGVPSQEPIHTEPADLDDMRRETEGGAMFSILLLGLTLVAAGYIVAELLASGWGFVK